MKSNGSDYLGNLLVYKNTMLNSLHLNNNNDNLLYLGFNRKLIVETQSAIV